MTQEVFEVEYSANNSGGRWWLSDADWENLDAAGWSVQWHAKEPKHEKYPILDADENGRICGALASRATIRVPANGARDALRPAVLMWESTVGKDAADEGCNCCGPPHRFSTSKEKPDEYYESASGNELANVVTQSGPLTYREALERIAELETKEQHECG